MGFKALIRQVQKNESKVVAILTRKEVFGFVFFSQDLQCPDCCVGSLDTEHD